MDKPKFNGGIDLSSNRPVSVADVEAKEEVAVVEPKVADVAPKKEVQEPVKQEEPIEVEKEIEEILPGGPMVDAVIMPSSTYEDIFNAMKIMNSIDDDTFADDFTDKESLAVGIVADGLRVTVKQNALVNTLKDKEAQWELEPKYADKALTIRELVVGKNAKGDLKGSAATAKFYNYLGLGGIIQVPLWHSGFWISLKPIKESDLLNLEMSIADNQIRLGRETNTLIYSNYSVVFDRLVLEFVTRHIQSCSLDIADINEITKYIKMQDLYPLVNGLIQSIYVKGFKDVRTCMNSLNINPVTGKPECDHTIESIIDPKKLLWVNRKALDTDHMKIMVKRGPKTVSIDEVLEYQSTLPVNKPHTYNIPTENGLDITMTLKAPTIDEHIVSGETWVNNIIDLTEKLFTEKLSVDEKNKRVNASSKMVLLSAYNHFIQSLGLPDGSTVSDKETMDNILEMLVSDQVAFKEILGRVKDYIDLNTIAVVGIPKYRCPNCDLKQGDDNLDEAFKDIIPINVLEAFFDLSILKTSKISERNLEENI